MRSNELVNEGTICVDGERATDAFVTLDAGESVVTSRERRRNVSGLLRLFTEEE